MSRPLITIFGATGAQGGGLADALLAGDHRTFRVRAATRRPGGAAARALSERGAEIVAADLDDPASVERAMQGAHGVFCMTDFWSHGSADRELVQADTLAEAAQRTRVRHVVWSTLEDTRRFFEPDASAPPLLQGHYRVPPFDAKGEADECFIGRGLPLTRLVTSFHWDNLVRLGLHPRRGSDGRLDFVLPIGDAVMPGIAAADVGRCAAALFLQGEAAIGRKLGIAGEHLGGAQMAAALGQALGEPVRHVSLPPEAFGALGVPAADAMAGLFRFHAEFEAEIRAARSVAATRALHPGLMDFAAWLRANAARIPVAPRVAA